MDFRRRMSFLLLLVVIGYHADMFAQKSTVSYNTEITVTDDVVPAKILTIGLDQTATEDIDLALGEVELPPMPPSGNFEARWILPQNSFSGSLCSYVDFRDALANPYTGQKTFRLFYQKSAAATYILVKWNLPANISGTLKDIVSGAIINVAVSGTGEYKVTNPAAFNKLNLILDFNQVSTSVEKNELSPGEFSLLGNYPNPFNPSTVIAYQIPEAGDVDIRVYSSNMESLELLYSGKQSAGTHNIQWSAASYPSGMYFYRVTYKNQNIVGKMILLK